MMPNWAQIRHAVGGSSLLHRRALVLMLPTTFLTSMLGRDISELSGLVGWGFANILGLLGCWLWIECIDRTLFRYKTVRPIAFGWVVMFGASVGALKGALTDLTGFAVGVGELVGIATAWRSVSNAVIGAVLIPALAAAHVAIQRYHSEYQLMVTQTLPTVGKMSPQSKAALVTFANDARETLRQVEAGQAAERIMGLIDERLRPYTHRLWAQTDTPPERLNLRSLLRITLARGPLPMVWIATVYALSVWPVSIELAGARVGTARTVIAGVVLYGTVTLARLMMPHTASMPVAGLHFGVTVGVATTLQILQWDHLFGGMPRASTVGMWVMVVVWLTLLLLFGGAVATAVRARAVVREAVMHAVGPQGLREIAIKDHDRLVAQRLASRLHADVQGQMLATARRIRAHHDAPEVVKAELSQLDQLLCGLHDALNQADPGVLSEQLAKLVSQWQGFLTVQTDVSDVRDETHTTRIVEVVREALTNAVRHGLATTVTVTVRSNAQGVGVTVTDDGIGPRNGPCGLGSTFFAAVSLGNWSLRPGDNGGSVLYVTLTDAARIPGV